MADDVTEFIAQLEIGKGKSQKTFSALASPDDALDEAKAWVEDAVRSLVEEHPEAIDVERQMVATILPVLADTGPAGEPTAIVECWRSGTEIKFDWDV